MGAISPGPSLALIMRNTVRGGRWHGMATGLGHGLGVGLYALIAAYGLALLLATTPGCSSWCNMPVPPFWPGSVCAAC